MILEQRKIEEEQKGGSKIEAMGYVYTLLPMSKKWRKFYLKKRVPFLYFYNSVRDNDFCVAYSIYKASIQRSEQFIPHEGKACQVFVISHYHD